MEPGVERPEPVDRPPLLARQRPSPCSREPFEHRSPEGCSWRAWRARSTWRPRTSRSSLFADLPGEHLVAGLPVPLSPSELALRANLDVTQRLLRRATGVTLEVAGNARVLVRHAKLRGLLCTVSRPASRARTVLEVSGPLALFRHTVRYGRALGSLVPYLAWCQSHPSEDRGPSGRTAILSTENQNRSYIRDICG